MKTLSIIAAAAVLVSSVIRIINNISIGNNDEQIWDIK